MQKYIDTFSNFSLGPYVAIDGSPISLSKHIDDILDKGYVPLALITDPEHEVFEGFKDRKDFDAKAIFITIKYNESYE